MNAKTKLRIFNDPIYGFITIPNEQIFELIDHPHFQRLRRIAQMGMSYLVYPGAHHTRFHHALGSMHLMQQSVQALRFKGIKISQEEERALLAAILLHDVGHGPFSHALEHSLVEGISHEQISLRLMETLDLEFNGSLRLAIEIFKGDYPRTFMCQLVSGQLDMDRLDYLKRDSFYTGVPDGNINAERMITMLNVVDNNLVVEEKGIYPVEKFLLARRLMYWQVYLHKTSLVAEQLLILLLKRAKELSGRGIHVPASRVLSFFLNDSGVFKKFGGAVLQHFVQLDDHDIMSAIKQWQEHEDIVLSELSRRILDRDLFKIKLKNKPFSNEKLSKIGEKLMDTYAIGQSLRNYFVFTGSVDNVAYRRDKQQIQILKKNGKIVDAVEASDQFNLAALSQPVTKYFLCYPKNLD